MNDSIEQQDYLVGYARVSTLEQNLSLQVTALREAGCKNIFTDKISGSKSNRPGLIRCLNHLQPGNQLVVWRLDRLGRSLMHLVSVVSRLREINIGFRSLMAVWGNHVTLTGTYEEPAGGLPGHNDPEVWGSLRNTTEYCNSWKWHGF